MVKQHTTKHTPLHAGVPEEMAGKGEEHHRVSPLDAAWLYVESPRTPMHIGCVEIFAKPKRAGADYTLKLYQAMLASTSVAKPFSLKLGRSALGAVLPSWVEEHSPDLEYHVRRTAVPQPGGESELATLLARLQNLPLDTSRPLWECYLIDGLENHRFAIYTKMHHSLVDGVGGMHLLQSGLSTDPHERNMPAPWACARGGGAVHKDSGAQHHGVHLHGALNHALETIAIQLRSGPELLRAFLALAKAALPGNHAVLAVPYTAPLTVFNNKISTQHQFAALQLPLQRLHELARRAEVKLNDVLLAICGGALRRFLKDADALPERSLVAGIPVSVRPHGDTTMGSAITFALSSLGTDVEHPARRLRGIHQATAAAKAHLQSMDRAALVDYTLLLMSPYILELLAGLGGRGHPVFNLVISNVPGPAQPLYYNGARLEAIYPLSILTHGQALNITVVSYDGQLNIGFTACKAAVPQLQRLADYTREALDELERHFPVADGALRPAAA
ncbi:MAG: wax ester/triacylglycerol synthase family O-acyltransferase [Nevskia sp.]|nr:wax ester/triacylglycerol synthase family O-acyltransferase [Nevskia sp.]